MKKLYLSAAFMALGAVMAHGQSAPDAFSASVDPTAIHVSDIIGHTLYLADTDMAGAASATDAETGSTDTPDSANTMGDAIDTTATSDGATAGIAYHGVQDDWDDIGTISDVLVSRDGQVEAVLVDAGGFLGKDAHEIAANMSAIQFVSDSSTPDDDRDFLIVLTASHAMLADAPAYHASAAGANAGTSVNSATDTGSDGGFTMDVTSDAAVSDGDNSPHAFMREGYEFVAPEALTGSDLDGAAVYDLDDRNVGSISDLILDSDGDIKAIVVDLGGFLGIGTKPVLLEMSNVDILQTVDGNELRAYISLSKEEMEALPDYAN